MTDHQHFQGWSASYVLGALESAEREEFEAHLAGCDECRHDVASFAPLPGLLGRLDSVEMQEAPTRIADLAADKVRSEWAKTLQSRRRWRWVAAVASALVVIGLIGQAIPPAGDDAGTSLSLDAGSVATGEVVVDARRWGTAVEIRLSDLPVRDRYVAWVVSDSGDWEQIASWGPTPSASASISGASSLPTDQLDSVVITAEDRDDTVATAHTIES